MSHPLFGEMGKEVCQALAERILVQAHPAGTTVVQRGQKLIHPLVAFEGVVRCEQRLGTDSCVISRFICAPALIGEVEVLSKEPAQEDITVIKRLKCAVVPAGDYLELLKAHAGAAAVQARSLARLSLMGLRQRIAHRESIERRIAHLLFCMAEIFGYMDGEVMVIDYRLSQQAVAQALGVVRRTVTPVMSAWRQAGLIGKRNGCLRLLDVNYLRSLAQPLRGSMLHSMAADAAVGVDDTIPLDRSADSRR